MTAFEKGAWLEELEKEKILQSEFKNNSDDEISFLLKADIAVKFIT